MMSQIRISRYSGSKVKLYVSRIEIHDERYLHKKDEIWDVHARLRV